MLGGGIVPHRHVARIPAPADRVLEVMEAIFDAADLTAAQIFSTMASALED
jgi:hypothetical protein